MSIFLALMFQVLFVFFAMVINIGLLVHDKINLQNSVDLGAYYAAQKQAEILNEIAHLNYQIRQDYKLLAWRYWVLGTLGRDGKNTVIPPARRVVGTSTGEAKRLYATPISGGPVEEVPVACLATPQWWEFAWLSAQRGLTPNENYCWHSYQWTSTAIPVPNVPNTPATLYLNEAVRMAAEAGRTDFTDSCKDASPFSWAFVATILTDYKHSVAYKKKAIKKLRENLVSADPKDRDEKSIREGVIQTIKKNLTESNLQSFDPSTVQMLNGLSNAACSGGNTAGANTLPEVLTAPGLYFALLTTRPSGECMFDIAFQVQYGAIPGGVNRWDQSGELRNQVRGEPGPDDEYHSTLGFEKNPWCMAYMGVKANTNPRKPFAPFGKAVNLVARAFAQPFGGRIGPWYSKTWTKNSLTSDPVAVPQASVPPPGAPAQMNPASNQDMRTDPLTSPRLMATSGGYQYSSYTIPNFSRFPGDTLGLRSQAAQAAARSYLSKTVFTGPTAPGKYDDYRIRLSWFYGFGAIKVSGDTAAFGDPNITALNSVPKELREFREVEMAAVAPNLFDITYYSIDPAADQNYAALAKLHPNRYGTTDAPVGDIGSRQNIPDLQKNNVESQVTAAQGTGLDATILPQLFWFIRDWKHVLTGWAPHRATNFNFPEDRFGKCSLDPVAGTMIPGKCVAGGRTGYSVRLISREHLNGPWKVGGENVPADTLLNPPGDDSQF